LECINHRILTDETASWWKPILRWQRIFAKGILTDSGKGLHQMKKFAAGVVLGFLANWAVASATPLISHNGSFWNRLNNAAKDGYVNGYSDAMRVSVGKLDGLNIAADLFHWKGARKIIHQLSGQLAMGEKLTSDQAVKRLDELYSNQKYSELELGQALQILTVRASEIGMPDAPVKGLK
jgi:hypothetical protein